jgi:hypothetical protein
MSSMMHFGFIMSDLCNGSEPCPATSHLLSNDLLTLPVGRAVPASYVKVYRRASCDPGNTQGAFHKDG